MIGLGSDHGGYELKNQIAEYLKSKGYEIQDFGVSDNTPIDYPDIAVKVSEKVADGTLECAFLFCGTGIGMSMAANKVKGIRAAHVTDSYSAKMTKKHNNANVVCMGGRITGYEIAREIVDEYLSASFDGGRHQARIDKISHIEE